MIQTVHCVDVLAGGVASMLFEFAEACENTVFNFVSIAPVETGTRNLVEDIGGRVIKDGIRTGSELAKAIRDAKSITGAKVFHTHRNWHNLQPAILAKCAGYQVVISHSHNVFPSTNIAKDVYRKLFQLAIKHYADACWGCSPEAIEFLYGAHPKNALFIPNPISFERFSFSEKAREAKRKELGLNESFVIVHAGLAIPQKNHEFLFRVFAALQEAIPDVKLLLVGPSRDVDHGLMRLAEELNIDENVTFCGYVDDVENYYAASDLFLFPSLNEGLPLALCEAQAEGLSFIASSNITLKSDLFGNGVFLPIDRGVEPWVEAVLTMDCSRRTPSAESIASSPFNVHRSAPLLEATYSALIDGSKPEDIAALWNEEG